jgi:hypothetical protein
LAISSFIEAPVAIFVFVQVEDDVTIQHKHGMAVISRIYIKLVRCVRNIVHYRTHVDTISWSVSSLVLIADLSGCLILANPSILKFLQVFMIVDLNGLA